MASAVAGSLARVPPARGAGGDTRRPIRRRLLGRAIRASRRGRTAAGDPPAANVESWVSLSAADPLNLIGILTPGQRLSALTANWVVYRDGLPVAALTGGKVQFLTELESADQWEAEKRLVRSAARGRLADLV